MAEATLGDLFAEYEKNSAVTILEAGKHTLEVATCTVRNNGLLPTYKILEGPDAGKRAMAGGIYPGETEGGRFAFFRKLEKFGLSKDFFSARPTLEDVATALKGRVVTLNLTISEWNGEPRNEMGFDIQLVSAPPLPGVQGIPVSAAPVQSAAPTGAATASSAPPVNTAVAEDDPGF